jgi:ABC-type polysaccharide/polyol phosphate transport system ATPase subunit
LSSEPASPGPPAPGQVRLRGVSRSFKLMHERNATLKETVLRRRRTRSEVFWAVQDISLDVAPGEAIGIVGRNGSGKSTLLKLLAGIMPPSAGTVELGGTVAAMLELGAGFHPDFTGRENVYMNGAIYGLGEREVTDRLDDIVAFAELEEFIDMPVRTYSSGMQMRLAFAVSSHVNPDVLLLDEVLAVGDESFQRKCISRLADYKRAGGTLVLVTHDPNSVEQMCDHAIVLAHGTVLAEGAPAKVLAAYRRRLVADDRERDEAHPADAHDETGSESQSWGDMRAQIVDARLIGPEGPASSFVSGDPLVLEMNVDAHERMDSVTYGMAVHSAEGHLCYGTNTHLDGCETSVLDGPSTVRFHIPHLHLHAGRFAITLAITDHDTVCHWLDRWIEFDIFQAGAGIGIVDMTGTWTIEPARSPDESPSVPAAPSAQP